MVKCKLCNKKFKKGHLNQIFCSKKCCCYWHDTYNLKRIQQRKNYIKNNKDLIKKRKDKYQKEWIKNGRKIYLEEYKLKKLPKKVEQVLIGSILGDGCISKVYKKSLRYGEGHCLKQRDYLLWKTKILSKFFKKYSFYDVKYRPQCGLKISSLDLYPYYKLFYPNGKKIVTVEILNMLKPLGLAVWYMDDGYYNKGECRISCSRDISEKFIKRFKEKFGINILLSSDGIRFRKKDSDSFIEIVKPYIHKNFFYKIDIKGERDKYNKYRRKYVNKNRERINKYSIESYHRNKLRR